LTSQLDIPADAALGEVLERLEPVDVLELCREQLTDVDAQRRAAWRGCQLIEALYHPGQYVRVAYALTGDEDTPPERYWPEAEIVYLHAPARMPVSRRGSLVQIGGQSIEAYVFPEDRRLRRCRRFAGRLDAARLWQSWLDAAGRGVQLDHNSLRRVLIRYVPEQKWIIRLRARSVSLSEHEESKHSIAVRVGAPSVCRELHRRHRLLNVAGDAAGFTVPEPVSPENEAGLLATQWIKGRSLLEELNSGNGDLLLGRIANALRKLHLRPIDGLPSLSSFDIRRRAGDAVADLALVMPDRRSELTELARSLRSLPIRCDNPVTLHNDFHWNQTRLAGDRIALLDLERMSVGDSMVDVANFVTQLRLLGRRPEHEVSPEQADRWADQFLDSWTDCCGNLDTARFHSCAALSCLELARGMMRHLRPGWRALAATCVERAEGHLAVAHSKGATR